jgi:hypothetical protein
VARKAEVEELKRRHGRRLLRIRGVVGVGVERSDKEDGYVLVVHVKEDDAETRAAVVKEVGDGTAVRIVKSGPFRKL